MLNTMKFYAVITLFTVLATVNSQSYTAGIVMYKSIKMPYSVHDEIIEGNIKNLVNLINSSKNKPDIFIFPEYAITHITARSTSKDLVDRLSLKIGKVGDDACINKTADNFQKVAKLACAAKQNNAYIIVNLLENEDDKIYVTNVGFDRNGTICLMCRKQHLNDSNFQRAPDQNACSFTASFATQSVKFSVLFGTDLLYPMPEAIKSENVIVTSSEMNNIPLNFGVSLYSGYAVYNGFNVLVADYNDVEKNYGGSGIFYANGTSVIAFNASGVPDATTLGAVLIREVPSMAAKQDVVNVQAVNVGSKPAMNLQYMNITAVPDSNKVVENCLEKRCCSFNADLTGDTISPYKWVIVSNKTSIFEQEVDIFFCGIVVPSANFVPTNFKNISIISTIDKSETVMTLPVVLNENFLPTNYTFNKNRHSITLSKSDNVVVFGVLEVVTLSSGSNTALIVVIVLLVLILVALLITFFIWRKRQTKNRRNF